MNKYIKGFSIFILFFLSSEYVSAQAFAPNFWHEGTVTLQNGQIYTGNLKFDLDNEIIQVQSRNGHKTLTSRKVSSFEFYDKSLRQDRIYYTLPFAKVSNYKTPSFFELVAQGKPISILSREKLVNESITANNGINRGFGGPTFVRTVVKYDMFFLYSNGKIKSFNGTKKGLLYLLQDREKDVKEYMKANRVRLDDREDIVNLILYYNTKKQ